MTVNKLKIRAQALNLELSGDFEYVTQAYEAIRGVLLDRFEATLRATDPATTAPAQPAGPETAGSRRDPTQPLHRVLQKVAAATAAAPEVSAARLEPAADGRPNHLHVVISGEIYNKISVVEREDFDTSVFGELLDSRHLERIFVDKGQTERLEAHFPLGKVLWRELTAAGKAAVRGDD